MLLIASLTLRADIAAASGNANESVRLLRAAATAEDGLLYDEPHLWLAPTRHALGAALLGAGRAREAERTYREDLAHYPENLWSLAGLAQALRRQGRAEAADDALARFRTARARADVAINASRF